MNINNNQQSGEKANKQQSSILFIRNLSLMIDILTCPLLKDHKTQSYLQCQSLFNMSSSASSTPVVSTTTTQSPSTATSQESQTTILDPIIQLLLYYNQNDNNDNDPLLVMNIFELIDKMTLSNNYTLLMWIVDSFKMIDFLLSKVGFHFVEQRNRTSMEEDKHNDEDGNNGNESSWSLCCNHDIDSFCYNFALSILSKC